MRPLAAPAKKFVTCGNQLRLRGIPFDGRAGPLFPPVGNTSFFDKASKGVNYSGMFVTCLLTGSGSTHGREARVSS